MPETLLSNVHPGEILLEEFLKPLGISQNKLAREIKVSPAVAESAKARFESLADEPAADPRLEAFLLHGNLLL
jgi:addiction module HigA family antidote